MPLTTGITVVSLISSLLGAKSKRKGEKAQQRALNLKLRQDELGAARSRRNIVREGRIKHAQVIAGAEASGSATSSGALGAAQSVRSQTSGELGFFDKFMDFERQIGRESVAAGKAFSKANMWSTIGAISSGASDITGGWTDIFSSSGGPSKGERAKMGGGG